MNHPGLELATGQQIRLKTNCEKPFGIGKLSKILSEDPPENGKLLREANKFVSVKELVELLSFQSPSKGIEHLFFVKRECVTQKLRRANRCAIAIFVFRHEHRR